MAGLLVKIFTWFLESRIFGTILVYMLKKNNLIHKVHTLGLEFHFWGIVLTFLYVYLKALSFCQPLAW